MARLENRLRGVLQEQWKCERLLDSLAPINHRAMLPNSKASQTPKPFTNIYADESVSEDEGGSHRLSSSMTLSPPPTRLQEAVSETRSSSIVTLSPPPSRLQQAIDAPTPLSEAIDDARKAILNMKKCMVCNQLMPKGDEFHKYCLPSTCIID